jgi:hypothetical protein
MVPQERVRDQIWAARPFNVHRSDRPGLEPSMLLVRVKGLEPPLPYGKQILSLPRLPFRHTRADRSNV